MAWEVMANFKSSFWYSRLSSWNSFISIIAYVPFCSASSKMACTALGDCWVVVGFSGSEIAMLCSRRFVFTVLKDKIGQPKFIKCFSLLTLLKLTNIWILGFKLIIYSCAYHCMHFSKPYNKLKYTNKCNNIYFCTKTVIAKKQSNINHSIKST